uniref:Nuclear envelope phosphatase-regulatory subunit 1 n=1 Tax=Gallus gallus TaxID=9031 RepID=A0A8V0ZVT1_CHICK
IYCVFATSYRTLEKKKYSYGTEVYALVILIVVSVCTATGAWNWLIDPETQKVSFFTSLWNHPFFTISCITLIGLFFAGIHKRVVAPSIIAARCRTVLAEYNMSCDDTGKLILKPRPHVQ